ncbi:nuclear transport factor 2 family protein (plasmid) [Streptomyces sp. BI20]|uniref:nuclear transport factor 2 family protein n=1 Tax=Streptomyces sp. BI20 TaxID=3403460 RepID=UPI003C790EEB
MDVQGLLDRAEIGGLLDRYARVFDVRDFGAVVPTLFTADCAVNLPPGTHEGVEGLDAFLAAVMAPFDRTQHVFTNYIVGVRGGRADYRANARITHLMSATGSRVDEVFTVGAVITGTATRTAEGWRLSTTTLDPVWREGEGPGPDMRV